MKALILNGNTRHPSNTETLANIFADELTAKGIDVTQVSLRKKTVENCVGCDKCHKVLDAFGCVINDDMQEIADLMMNSDLVLFSSPIYTWMPAPPLKSVMDRVYAFTKYPKNGDVFNLLKSQKFAVFTTCGGEIDENCDIFDKIVARMAHFAFLPYIGSFAARDFEDGNIARPEVIEDIRVFADKCAAEIAK